MSKEVVDKLRAKFPAAVVSHHAQWGDETVLIQRESLLEVMRWLKEECAFEMLMDLTAVDYLGETPRFEVVYHLKSLSKKYRLRVKARVPEDDPTIASLCPLWKGANWFERECHEFYGIRFQGHPDLRPLLLYPEFQGYPLRKDYPLDRRQPRLPLIAPETKRFARALDETGHEGEQLPVDSHKHGEF